MFGTPLLFDARPSEPGDYRPAVIGCLDGAVCNYGEALRMATAQRRPLIVCVDQPRQVYARERSAAKGAIVCIATRADGFATAGTYRYRLTPHGLGLVSP